MTPIPSFIPADIQKPATPGPSVACASPSAECASPSAKANNVAIGVLIKV